MKYRDVVKVLRKNDWIEVRCKGTSHHVFKKEGNPYSVPVADHGSKDIPIGTLKSIEGMTGLSLRR